MRPLSLFLSYVRPYWCYFAAAIIMVITSAMTILTFGYGLHQLIDIGFSESNFITVNNSLYFLFIIVLVMSLASFGRIYFVGHGTEKLIYNIRCDIYNHLIHLPPSFFEKNSLSRIMSVLMTDTTKLQLIISGSLSVALRNIIVLLSSFVMLFIINSKLTIYTTLIIPLIVAFLGIFGKKSKALSKLLNHKIEHMYSFIEETLRGVTTVQSFNQENKAKHHLLKLVKSTSLLSHKTVNYRALLITFMIALVTWSVVIILWLGMKEVIAGRMTAGLLSTFIFYAALAAGAVNNLGDNIINTHKVLEIMDRIADFFRIQVEKPDTLNPGEVVSENILFNNLSFNGVTFYYPSRLHHPALNNISFSIKKGEFVALVGPSGGGKSTIINLILRFYQPVKGNITINSTEIQNFSLKNSRSIFALVPQDPIIFSTSIWNNITYGVDDVTYERVIEASRSAYVLEFIDKLPEKFDTFVGERGITLSEGQKQRIIIARAILKRPQVLILDEATSFLDAENEMLVQKALGKLMKNKTTLAVAHRFSTILRADKIIVINNGKIEEIGTHKSLSQKDGLYSRMVKLQLYINNEDISEF